MARRRFHETLALGLAALTLTTAAGHAAQSGGTSLSQCVIAR